jgi:hypothetical protein
MGSPYGSEVKMDALAKYRYDALRYMPIRNELYPIQVLGSTLRTDVPQTAIVELSLEEAKDLHTSLGEMIKNV